MVKNIYIYFYPHFLNILKLLNKVLKQKYLNLYILIILKIMDIFLLLFQLYVKNTLIINIFLNLINNINLFPIKFHIQLIIQLIQHYFLIMDLPFLYFLHIFSFFLEIFRNLKLFIIYTFILYY